MVWILKYICLLQHHVVDLRSDTVTKPTDGMKKAMMEALLGDDVYREDPTVSGIDHSDHSVINAPYIYAVFCFI